jgi:ParB-like chromosome segregation protein Spo0J
MRNETKRLIDIIKDLPLDEKVEALNYVRKELHEISPFRSEPTDLVLWVKNESVHANNYNPNSVAPTEMDLLKLSIEADGYTQPIVTMPVNKNREVIDGFHRHLCGKTYEPIQKRIHGYLPVVTINSDRESLEDRMAATVRHNRARGKHKVESMSEIVVHLKRRQWSDTKIAKHLGMDADEVLRLRQITGLAEMFKDREFSEAWEVENEEDLIE